jgi:hypothetical protein
MPTRPGSRDYGRFDELAEEFAERYRRGERPDLQQYVDRLPGMAEESPPISQPVGSACTMWLAERLRRAIRRRGGQKPPDVARLERRRRGLYLI